MIDFDTATTPGSLRMSSAAGIVEITPWGPDAFRVRASTGGPLDNPESALIEPVKDIDCRFDFDKEGNSAQAINGNLYALVSRSGKITFSKVDDGSVLLEEYARDLSDITSPTTSALKIVPRELAPILGTDSFRVTARFESQDPNERIYGMGQYQEPFLNLKGSDIDLSQRNSQASVPFHLSSRGYGFLWNCPAIGRVVFGRNVTTLEAESAKILDYWVVAGDHPKDILRAYTAVTGRPPMMPEYGLGLWQSKLRYQTQEELLGVAREYKKRKIPIDVIVCDYFHWPAQGDWKFDPTFWPDPEAMIEELKSLNIELMVSIWPTVDTESENYRQMFDKRLLARQDRGWTMHMDAPENHKCLVIDPTNPATRKFVWDTVKRNYWDKGVKIFWLDEAEPEYRIYDFDVYRYHAGPVLAVGNAYPKYYSQAFYEGMQKELGHSNIVNLVRCAWAGSQKFGALLWSGDVGSSWKSMKNQFCAGLGAGLAGISWWTTDIGGFHGGNVNDPAFHELFVRWLQWGTFLPVMRIHGDRQPKKPRHGTTGGSWCLSGSENEIWSFGEEVYEICKAYVLLRESMRPYIRDLMQQAHEHGEPLIRPMFYEFPEDQVAWTVEDQYMFGDRYLVAPVFGPGVGERQVYLPKGKWSRLNAKGDSAETLEGGRNVMVKCPLSYMPVFSKE